MWNAETGQQEMVLDWHIRVTHSAAYSPDGKYIVAASSDDSAYIWDATDMGLIQYACTRIYQDFIEPEPTTYGITHITPTCDHFGP